MALAWLLLQAMPVFKDFHDVLDREPSRGNTLTPAFCSSCPEAHIISQSFAPQQPFLLRAGFPTNAKRQHHGAFHSSPIHRLAWHLQSSIFFHRPATPGIMPPHCFDLPPRLLLFRDDISRRAMLLLSRARAARRELLPVVAGCWLLEKCASILISFRPSSRECLYYRWGLGAGCLKRDAFMGLFSLSCWCRCRWQGFMEVSCCLRQ